MKRGSVSNRLLDRYIGIPVLLSTSLLARRRRLPSSIRRIGISSSPTLGDTLICSAAVKDLRRHYPAARLIFFASRTNLAAAELLPGIDELAKLDITRPLSAIQTIRQCRLDLMIDFTPWQRLTAFYTAASGAKYRVGFRTAGQHRHWHYDLTADHSPAVHELENFRSLLRALGLQPSAEPSLCVPAVPPPDLERASEKIVLHPWATGDRAVLREWPAERWVELALRLQATDTLFLITGSPAQFSRSEALCRLLRAANLRAQPYLSPNGLAPLCALLQNVDLVVSVNTGIMHLAAILGAPTVAINGPTSAHRWGPLGPRAISVAPHGGGGGFLHLGFEFAGNPSDSMERTPVEDVFAAARTLMPVPSRLAKAATA